MYVFKAHTIHVAPIYTNHTLCAETCFGGDDMDLLGLMRQCQQVLGGGGVCFGPDAEALWPSGRLLSAPMCRHKAFRYEPSHKYS